MKPQILTTASGEEPVVLSRRDYDVLLARLGDEDADDRMTVRLVEETRAALDAGTEFLLPVWFSDGLIARRHPIRIVREQAGRTRAQVAEAAGIGEAPLAAIEAGTDEPSMPVLDAVSAATGNDPRILRAMFAPDP